MIGKIIFKNHARSPNISKKKNCVLLKKLPVVTKHPVSLKTPATIIISQRSPTISRVLAKPAMQYKYDKIASIKQKLDSVEEIDEDLAAFQELDEFLEEDEILDG